MGSELSFEEGDGELDGEELILTGVDPLIPTEAKPGSEEKVKMLAARYAAGIPLWHEVYAPFNMIAFPCGNTGVQMTGWFKREIKSVKDFNGLKMRIPGLAGKVYATLGVDVKLLPGGEIFPALERGVIDAAEFVGPYQDRRLGLQKAAK